jgi:hypothetical protein
MQLKNPRRNIIRLLYFPLNLLRAIALNKTIAHLKIASRQILTGRIFTITRVSLSFCSTG